MKRFFAISLMILGLVALAGSLFLYIANTKEDEQAQELTEYYLPLLIENIKNGDSTDESSDISDGSADSNVPSDSVDSSIPDSSIENPPTPDYSNTEMKVIVIDGHEFVGYLSIPKFNLELPVMAETNDAKLKIAPCRFYGSVLANNLVIGAHNYSRHFGKIGDLSPDDEIYFTDADGNTYKYAVVSIEILQPNDVDILTNAEYDLTLYTCTYGGRTRVTVRCDKID